MFKFGKSTRVLIEMDDENVKVLDVFKANGKTFKMFCDVKKAQDTIGVNTNYCLSVLTDSGWAVVADNNELSIPKVKRDEDNNELLEKIESGFKRFKEYAKLI